VFFDCIFGPVKSRVQRSEKDEKKEN